MSPRYLIMRGAQIIRVYHDDLDNSYWKRASSSCEREMQDVERTIMAATGLKRVFRKHGRVIVDFHINDSAKFNSAAIAVMMKYPAPSPDMSSYLKRAR